VGAALMVLLYLLTGVLVATVPAIGNNSLTSFLMFKNRYESSNISV
jgi:hypothetical protein